MPRLLWTDDDGPRRFMMEEFTLRRAGWDVEWAQGMSPAVRKLEQSAFDVVILDQMIPWNDAQVGIPGENPVDVWGGCLLLWWLRRGTPPPTLHRSQVERFGEMWTARPLAANRSAPVTIVSAFEDPDVREQLLLVSGPGEGGCAVETPIWTKPVDRDVLMQFLREGRFAVDGTP